MFEPGGVFLQLKGLQGPSNPLAEACLRSSTYLLCMDFVCFLDVTAMFELILIIGQIQGLASGDSGLLPVIVHKRLSLYMIKLELTEADLELILDSLENERESLSSLLEHPEDLNDFGKQKIQEGIEALDLLIEKLDPI